MWVKATKILFVSVLLFVSYLIGYNSYPRDRLYKGESKEFINDEQNRSPFEGKYQSPNDSSKVLFVDGLFGGIYLLENNVNLRFITNISSPRNITWSGDSSKVSVTSHISSDEDVYIINFETGQYIIAEGRQQFIDSQNKPELYSHVYAGPLGWDDDNNLIIVVTGYPDGNTSFRPPAQHFLVSSDTGEILEEIQQ